jgi:hypothetical protein
VAPVVPVKLGHHLHHHMAQAVFLLEVVAVGLMSAALLVRVAQEVAAPQT